MNSDLHTHTVFSDGENTPEENVLAAIEKGLESIGITDHAYEPFDDCCIKLGEEDKYKAEINRLKEVYKDKINVLCGIEYDYYSEGDRSGYDYVIGSVHYLKINGKVYSLDTSIEETERCINEAFDGDKYAFAEAYYEKVSELHDRVDADIVGHFDLITKFEKQGLTFDVTNPRYRRAYRKAIVNLVPYCVFEINTGAMRRGITDRQYPCEEIIEDLKKTKIARVMFCSDAHKASDVGSFFDILDLEYIKDKK